MKGLRDGLRFLAMFMAVIMIFAAGAFVTTESFHAAGEDDWDVYAAGEGEFREEYVDEDFGNDDDDDYEGEDDDGYYEAGEDDWDELEDGLEDDIDEGYGYSSEDVYDDEDEDDEDDEDDEEDSDSENEDDADEEEYLPSGSFETTGDNGLSIEASYDEGIFTEEVLMNTAVVASDKLLSDISGVIENAKGAVGVDISFTDEEEEIWSLDDNEISFTLRAKELPEGEEFSLVHINDEGTAKKLPNKIEDKTVSFTADSFGVYAIVGTGEEAAAEEQPAEEQQEAAAEVQPAAETVQGVYQVQVAALNGTKVYDGEGVDTSDFISAVIVNGNVINDYSISGDVLQFTFEGNSFSVPGISVSADGDIRDVGHYDIIVSGGGTTVASTNNPAVSCQIIAENGSYEVTRREIVLTSASGEWHYDGKVHKAPTVTISGDGWLDGDEPSYYFPNTIKDIGSEENYFVLKKDASDNNTNWAAEYPNYNVVVAYGVLRVSPAR